MKRHYFEKISGYEKIPLMEDVEIMRRIRRTGDEICILPERVQTFAVSTGYRRCALLHTPQLAPCRSFCVQSFTKETVTILCPRQENLPEVRTCT